MKRFLPIFLIAFFACILLKAQTYTSDWNSIDSRATPSWFEDAKFGIFIHWGLFSVPAYSPTVRDGVGVYDRYAEWYWRKLVEPGSTQAYFTKFHEKTYGKDFKYQDFAPLFKAEAYQPEEWAKLFERAGAKYVVLTSKHHEGFTLWPSKYAWNWNAKEIGPHRDLLGDLTKAVKGTKLKMGYYYSLYEWYNPLCKPETINQYVDEHMMPQMKELVNTYQPDIFWTDGEWDYPSSAWKSTQFLSWLYNESTVKSTVVVNDRWGKETRSKHGGIYTTEYDLVDAGDASVTKFDHPWEECRGIAGSFGYNRMEQLDDYSTSEELIHILINKVARGGNLLLNVGPTADGRIPVIMQQRLSDMGQWLKVNGEAIYATRKWEKSPAINNTTTQYYTRKDKDLYLISTKFPTTDLIVSDVNKPMKVSFVGLDLPVTSSYKNGKLIIKVPNINPANNPCNYAWVFKLEGAL